MGLFGLGKKKDEKSATSSVNSSLASPPSPPVSSESPAGASQDGQVVKNDSIASSYNLPPMPASRSDSSSQAAPSANSSPSELGELPELPDLPSFDNHPESQASEMTAPQEEKPVIAQSEMEPEDDGLDEFPQSEDGSVDAGKSLPPLSAQTQKSFKDEEEDLHEAFQSTPTVVDTNKPIFIDAMEYQDILRDLHITKDDLKHIHDRSEIASHEQHIDAALQSFKKNIFDAKKKLNHIDGVLFTR